MNIGFDIDGVLVNDVLVGSNVKDMLEVRKTTKPLLDLNKLADMVTIFNCQKQVDKNPCSILLVTGRPIMDASDTLAWMRKFDIRANLVINKNQALPSTDPLDAARFKLESINLYSLEVFIESCPIQASFLKENSLLCRVYHFEDLIRQTLFNVITK